jgi:putative CocE/NonD family hydrolase
VGSLYRRGLVAGLLVTAVGAALAAPWAAAGPVSTAEPAAQSPAQVASGWTARAEQYPGTVTQKDLAVPMSDGVVLRGDLMLPADASGEAISGRFPVIVTIAAYNKAASSFSGGLAGGDPSYLVKRGYAQLTVDARGTGSSGGTWGAFSARENKDSGEIVAWAHSPERPWSDGNVGMRGPSYMGINQLFAAEHQPPGLKAIFPQVPAADVYRDVVASGGALDVGFIPLWLGLVTATGLVPPAYAASDPASGLGVLVNHLIAGGTFTAPLLLNATLGQEPAYDGPFYEERSPITDIDKVQVPTFLIGGEYDLFQRGTPLVYEALHKRGVPTKMIFGPWDHLQGSSGEDVADAGYGTLDELQLRWFDRYVKGIADRSLDSDIPSLTYYEQGSRAWRTADSWIGKRHEAASFRLSGTSMPGRSGSLTRGKAAGGTSTVLPIPVSGLCSRSMSQWTAGLPRMVWADNPCLADNRLTDATGVVFETAPLEKGVSFQGPLNARLYTSSTTGDGMLAVAVSDVAPDGTVTRLTGGWQVLSHRALDRGRSRYLDGKLIQPYHPFTKAAQKRLAPGQVAPVDVEVFPTGARIEPGHRLRISVQAFDVPHLLMTAPNLVDNLAVLRIHNSAAYPSELTLPVVTSRR